MSNELLTAAANISALQSELAAAMQLRDELQSALQWAKEELATVTAERDALKKERDESYDEVVVPLKAERDALKAELQHYIDQGLIVRRDGGK